MVIPRKRLGCAAQLRASVTAAPAGSSAAMEPLETRLLLAGVPTLAAGAAIPNVDVGAGENPAPAVADWNENGEKDLLVGDDDGYVYRYLNGGTDPSPSFTAPGTLTDYAIHSGGIDLMLGHG